MRGPGIFQGPRYAGQCSKVKDDVDPSDRLATHVRIAQVAAQKLDLACHAREVRFIAGAEIVDDAHMMSERHKPFGKM
jgi:hypothetical protein